MSARQAPIAIVSQPGLYPLQGFHGYNQRRTSQLGNYRFPQSGYAAACVSPPNSDRYRETPREYIWEAPPSYPGFLQQNYDGDRETQHSHYAGDGEPRNGNPGALAPQQGNSGALAPQQGNPGALAPQQGNPGARAPQQGNSGAPSPQQGNPKARATQQGIAGAPAPQQGNTGARTPQQANPGAWVPQRGNIGTRSLQEDNPEDRAPQQDSQTAGSSPGATYNNAQSAVVINQGQLQTVRRRRLDLQVMFACCTIWLGNPLFGLIGFLIARK